MRVDLDAYVNSLSLGEQQQVEILRALMRGSRVPDPRRIDLDADAAEAIEELGELMRRLVARGIAVIFITHKLNEAIAFGDRISVLQARPQGRAS